MRDQEKILPAKNNPIYEKDKTPINGPGDSKIVNIVVSGLPSGKEKTPTTSEATIRNGLARISSDSGSLDLSTEVRRDLEPTLNETFTTLTPNSAEDEYHTMSILDESAKYIFEVMKRQKNPEEPEDINAVCNCAKQIVGLMNIKINAIRLKGQLKGRI